MVRAGVVYTLPKEQAAEIWSYLHHREKDGYSMRVVDVYNEQGEVIERDVRPLLTHGSVPPTEPSCSARCT